MASTSSTSNTKRVFRLAAGPNNYDWGPKGSESLVAQFAPQAAKPGYKVEKDDPYSELWMGTHPTNPSSIYPSGPLLSEHLKANPDLLGDATKFPPPFTTEKEKEGEGHVPFLFKILCAEKALPLQIHPNKDLAAKLHEQDPDNFPDTNHKPEIAVCLSDRFLGFANFRPLVQIQYLLRCVEELGDVPELKSATSPFLSLSLDVGSDNDDEAVEAMKKAWKAFLSPESVKSDKVKKAVSGFAARVAKEDVEVFGTGSGKGQGQGQPEGLDERGKKNLTEAVERCERYYPGDPATLACIVFMNLVELHKGEGMYVGADGLHAWLKGDIVELMATSDNVLNVGFTDPSEISQSLDTVSQTVTAHPVPSRSIILDKSTFAKSSRGNTTVYSVPFEEFSILNVSGEDKLQGLTGPAVGIVIGKKLEVSYEGGETEVFETGMVFFVGANTPVEFKGDVDVWMAFYDGSEKVGGQVGKQ